MRKLIILLLLSMLVITGCSKTTVLEDTAMQIPTPTVTITPETMVETPEPILQTPEPTATASPMPSVIPTETPNPSVDKSEIDDITQGGETLGVTLDEILSEMAVVLDEDMFVYKMTNYIDTEFGYDDNNNFFDVYHWITSENYENQLSIMFIHNGDAADIKAVSVVCLHDGDDDINKRYLDYSVALDMAYVRLAENSDEFNDDITKKTHDFFMDGEYLDGKVLSFENYSETRNISVMQCSEFEFSDLNFYEFDYK